MHRKELIEQAAVRLLPFVYNRKAGDAAAAINESIDVAGDLADALGVKDKAPRKAKKPAKPPARPRSTKLTPSKK